LREALNPMEFIVAGITSIALFFYLLYALLQPERF
jgi:K+-transporting ATPase KdpF subunit